MIPDEMCEAISLSVCDEHGPRSVGKTQRDLGGAVQATASSSGLTASLQ